MDIAGMSFPDRLIGFFDGEIAIDLFETVSFSDLDTLVDTLEEHFADQIIADYFQAGTIRECIKQFIIDDWRFVFVTVYPDKRRLTACKPAYFSDGAHSDIMRVGVADFIAETSPVADEMFDAVFE